MKQASLIMNFLMVFFFATLVASCGANDARFFNSADGIVPHDPIALVGESVEGGRILSQMVGGEFEFLIGAGIGDITGPAVGLATAGYAAPAPKTSGIHQRLLARTFVLSERADPTRRVVLVTADLCYITGIVKAQVIRELRAVYGDAYRHDNVLIAATHTHSGPAGFSQHVMYNVPSRGFSQENFDAIVSGIVDSVAAAHDRLEPGNVVMSSGSIQGGNRNRSYEAFLRNPAALRAELPTGTDETVTMLRFETAGGVRGILHWYATHATSMTKRNPLISGDNKGYAAWRFEKWVRKFSESANGEFVAAFANSNGGDASPNVDGDVDGDGDWECAENDDFKCTARIGSLQFDSAWNLFSDGGQALRGQISTAFQFVDMPTLRLPSSVTGVPEVAEVCLPAIGISMLAGSAEDGPGVGVEGVSCESDGMLVDFRCHQARYQCHGNKPVVLSGENLGRSGFTARVVPVQLLTIGSLAIAGVPAEVTSMAGHELRKSIQRDLAGDGIGRVVIAAYANEYTNYVTTRDEYQAQHYEGGSTLFGEWTLAAYQFVFQQLAGDLRSGTVGDSSFAETIEVPMLIASSLQSGDRPGRGRSYGEVLEDASASYTSGELVRVRFQGSNLNNDMRRGASFFEIQYEGRNGWEVVATDRDFNTRLIWAGDRGRRSNLTIEWDIPDHADTGNYRISLSATANDVRSGAFPYQGYSRIFSVGDAR